MDTNRELGRASSSATGRSFLSRTFTRRPREPGDGLNGPKGPLGLTTVYDPGDAGQAAVADIIFVHGLNGGSQSTWSKGNIPSNFWPKAWLPVDDAFRDVRIHSFGYSSGLNRESVLNVRDFAKSLLCAVNDCPVIRQDGKVRVREDVVMSWKLCCTFELELIILSRLVPDHLRCSQHGWSCRQDGIHPRPSEPGISIRDRKSVFHRFSRDAPSRSIHCANSFPTSRTCWCSSVRGGSVTGVTNAAGYQRGLPSGC